MRSLVAVVLACLVLSLAGTPSVAQLEYPSYALGIRPVSEHECGMFFICDANPSVPTTGVYRIEVYFGSAGSWEADGLRFAIDMPEEWTVQAYELCEGITLTAGDPFHPGEGLEVVSTTCAGFDVAQKAMFLTVDCATPGAGYLVGRPGEWEPLLRSCDILLWDEGSPGHVEQRVQVGDFCSRLSFNGPCEYCQRQRSAIFEPERMGWTLAPGGTATSSLTVYGSTGAGCGLLPECGGMDYDGDCFGGLDSAMPPWVSAAYLYSEGSYTHFYELTVDADGLLPGVYPGRIYSTAACPTCVPMCMDVTLSVVGPADVDPSAQRVGLMLEVMQNPVVSLIEYTIETPTSEPVRVDLFNVAGERVTRLFEGSLSAGPHALSAARDPSWPVGQYFLRVETPREMRHQRLTLAPR